MTTLFKQINEGANEHIALVEHTMANTRLMFEGFSDEKLATIVESAAKYLGLVSASLKLKGQIQDMEKAIDMVTALRVLGTAENRDAFNVKRSTFKVLVQKAGDAPNVDAALSKLSKSPSVVSMRQQVKDLLTAATQGDENKTTEVVNLLNKLRLGYERVQNQLQSADANSVGQPVDRSKQTGAKPEAVPGVQPTQSAPAARPQNPATGNRSTATA